MYLAHTHSCPSLQLAFLLFLLYRDNHSIAHLLMENENTYYTTCARWLCGESVYMHWWCGGSVIFSCDGGGGGVCAFVCVCACASE